MSSGPLVGCSPGSTVTRKFDGIECCARMPIGINTTVFCNCGVIHHVLQKETDTDDPLGWQTLKDIFCRAITS